MKTRSDPSTKPYYKCLSCPRFRKVCGGIPTREMSLKEWCEYMRDVKDIAHLTNSFISKEADVSIGTIERIMALNDEKDIMRAIARRIELVVLGPVGEHFCELKYDNSAVAEKINELQAKIEELREENTRKAKIIDRFLEN